MTTRIEKLQARITKLEAGIAVLVDKYGADVTELKLAQAELQSLLRIESVQAGDEVTFSVGRKDDRQELTGKVLGVKDDEAKGKLIRVFAGEGMEAQVYTVQAKDVLAVGGTRFVEPEDEVEHEAPVAVEGDADYVVAA